MTTTKPATPLPAHIAERIARIFSGSCTPACDLQDLVSRGEIRRAEAEWAVRGQWGVNMSLAEVARMERDDICRRDC